MQRARHLIRSVNLISRNRRRLVVSGLLLAIAAVPTAHSTPTKTAKLATTSGAEDVSASSNFATPTTDQRPRALVTIRPTGFDPLEITVSSGQILLAFDNKSGLRALTLRLVRDGGGRELRWSFGGRKLREKLTLPAGDYTLTESDHPDWLCRITVSD